MAGLQALGKALFGSIPNISQGKNNRTGEKCLYMISSVSSAAIPSN
jgi:hypothetical protein